MAVEDGLTIDTNFIERLSSADPTPGGGGASAYCGALAGACAAFVGNLTYNNKKFDDISDVVAGAITRLNDATSDLIYLVDRDALSFLPVSKALKMEKGELRDRKLNKALLGACETPLEIMQKCLDIIDECDLLAKSGSRLAVSDIGCAASMAKAALISASLNVYVNIRLFTDMDKAAHYKELVDGLVSEGVSAADSIYQIVADEIDAWRLV